MTDKNTTHLAGEFLVAGELARRGYPVAITFGNAKSIDIYASSKSGDLHIDAKAGRYKGNWPITENNINKDVFYIFVYLQSPKNILNNNSPPGNGVKSTVDPCSEMGSSLRLTLAQN